MKNQKNRFLVATIGSLAFFTLTATASNAHNVGTCHSHADEGVCEDDGSAGGSTIDAAAMTIYAPLEKGAPQGAANFEANNSKKRAQRRKKRRRR